MNLTNQKRPIIDLISDTGIQFYSFDMTLDLNPKKEVIEKEIAFWEVVDVKSERIILEFARRLGDSDLYAKENQLKYEGFIDEDDNLIENIEINLLETKTEEGVYSIYDIEEVFNIFKNKWIPLPYFQSNMAGFFQDFPTNWSRLMLVPQGKHARKLNYKVVLAFDTNTKGVEKDGGPTMRSGRGVEHFELCNNLSQILNFCDPSSDIKWMEDFLRELDEEWRKKEDMNRDPDNEEPQLKYIARYIYFIKYMASLNRFPAINLSKFELDKVVNVDLVLDIGNSRTNGILVESPSNSSKAFKFKKVDILKLQDLSDFSKKYDEPFSMRLVFQKASFGEIGYESRQFTWPSFIRLGKEAKRLIYLELEATESKSKESMSYYSSPKRYLWDQDLSDMQWELVNIDGEDHINRDLFIDGITQQFKEDGTFTPINEFGAKSNFSRKSLMTFVFIEILAQAYSQINSVEFREKHGLPRRARKLKRIVVTCPTAMTQEEQVTLRQCAEEASIVINRFYNNTYKEEFDPTKENNKVEIIPSANDCKKDRSQLRNKKDWNYDEATCCQLVFMYAEISQRYNNKCDKFFNLYGKRRNDLEDYTMNSVTVGSIDIGGGTTDLMISAYKYQGEESATIEPIPLYYESFNCAGDDLLNRIIKRVILDYDVKENSPNDIGVLSKYAKKAGVSQISIKLNTFFSTDSNNFGYKAIQMRKKFNVQILIPIAECYLEHVSKKKKDTILSFDEIFVKNKPNRNLLDYFYSHWGFRFENIQWEFNKATINKIIESTFDELIKYLSILTFVKKCDFVLLAGRPTSLEVIYEMFLKYFPVTPDRIISLNEYRVGRWYPFQDGNGFFNDHKSIVSVGAAIALLGGKLDMLSPFRLKLDSLIQKTGPTSEYYGKFRAEDKSFDNAFIDPEDNRVKIQVDSLPIPIGAKQLLSSFYPAKLTFELDYDYEAIKQRYLEQNEWNEDEQSHDQLKTYISKITNRTPFTISIVRKYKKSKEKLIIENVVDHKKNVVSKKFFRLRLKTINERKGHWLDTGEFTLSVQPG